MVSCNHQVTVWQSADVDAVRARRCGRVLAIGCGVPIAEIEGDPGALVRTWDICAHDESVHDPGGNCHECIAEGRDHPIGVAEHEFEYRAWCDAGHVTIERRAVTDSGVTWRGGNEMNGAELIAAERQRQIDEEGWSPEHDAGHSPGALALAGATYALNDWARGWTIPQRDGYTVGELLWPWPDDDPASFKPTPGNRIRELTKAGALIAAEIDRMAALAEGGK